MTPLKGGNAPPLAQYWSEKEQDGRAYKHPHTGVRVPSVTTITGMEDKPGLAQYAADTTLRWAVENWSLLGSRSDEDSYRAGRWRWKDHTNFLAQIGTDAHAVVEADLNGLWELPEVWGEAEECVEQWYAFRQAHEVVPVYTEVTCWSHEHGYAGTADIIAIIDGVPTVSDLKTSRGLYDAHKMQAVALSRADVLMIQEGDEWIEVDMPEFEALRLIQIRPDYYNPVNGKTEEAFWHMEDVPREEWDHLFQMFLGYKEAWTAKQALKGLRK